MEQENEKMDEITGIEIYEKLYDVVNQNMISSGKTFGYNSTTFSREVGNNPRIINVERYLDLDNLDFFQAIFVATFKRLPDEKEIKIYDKYKEEEKESFQEHVLKIVEESSVVAINHMEFINNPYFVQKKGIKYKITGKLYGLTDKSYLREFGKKMPMSIQKIVRKVFL